MYSMRSIERFFQSLPIPFSFFYLGDVFILTPAARANVAETAARARVKIFARPEVKGCVFIGVARMYTPRGPGKGPGVR